MTQGIHRPKRPDLVKSLLLDACVQQLANGEPLSIGIVAEVAGVTKGAVQHHFPTREALLIALYDHLMEEFLQQVADDGSGASPAWRYARIAAEAQSGETIKYERVLLAACLAERAVNAKWVEWARKDREMDGPDINKLVVRLAADGLWLSEVLGCYDLSPIERKALSETLQKLSQGV